MMASRSANIESESFRALLDSLNQALQMMLGAEFIPSNSGPPVELLDQ